jgi:hypothetical protein
LGVVSILFNNFIALTNTSFNNNSNDIKFSIKYSDDDIDSTSLNKDIKYNITSVSGKIMTTQLYLEDPTGLSTSFVRILILIFYYVGKGQIDSYIL